MSLDKSALLKVDFDVGRQRRCSDKMEKTNNAPEALYSAVLSGLDLLPIAFVVLDQRGKILIANRAAKKAMGRGHTIAITHDVLSVESSQQNKNLRELIVSVGQAEERAFSAITVSRGAEKPIPMLVIPVKNSRRPGQPASLVFFNDPEVACVPDAALLARLFGFTRAEARVASLVMQGKIVGDIAAALQITEHTTRNHLKRLFAKTNTRKQGELVYALLSSPAFLSLTPQDR
jgi:DNA-binding CsgD family transcriptional regulator